MAQMKFGHECSIINWNWSNIWVFKMMVSSFHCNKWGALNIRSVPVHIYSNATLSATVCRIECNHCASFYIRLMQLSTILIRTLVTIHTHRRQRRVHRMALKQHSCMKIPQNLFHWMKHFWNEEAEKMCASLRYLQYISQSQCQTNWSCQLNWICEYWSCGFKHNPFTNSIIYHKQSQIPIAYIKYERV